MEIGYDLVVTDFGKIVRGLELEEAPRLNATDFTTQAVQFAS
jgi:hypothetical protein